MANGCVHEANWLGISCKQIASCNLCTLLYSNSFTLSILELNMHDEKLVLMALNYTVSFYVGLTVVVASP